MNKNFSVSKFLLPTSVIMMIIGSVLLFGGIFNVFDSSFYKIIKYEYIVFILFFGFVFFITSLIDRSITRKRNITDGVEPQNLVPEKTNTNWIRVGVVVIITVVCFLGLLIVALNNISG